MSAFDFDTEKILGLKNRVVYIEGNLTVDTDKLPLMGLLSRAYAEEGCKAYADLVVPHDLVIDDNNADEYSSFTNFLVRGNVSTYRAGGDSSPIYGAMGVYWERRNEFYELLKTIDDNTPQLLLQLLYVSVFSRYEYAIIQNILSFSKYRMGNIVAFFNSSRLTNRKFKEIIKENIPDRIKEIKYMAAIRQSIYAGNIPFVENLISVILNQSIKMPPSLESGYEIRNSIVHRVGCDVNGYFVDIAKADVELVAKDMDEFTDNLTNLFHKREMEICQSRSI